VQPRERGGRQKCRCNAILKEGRQKYSTRMLFETSKRGPRFRHVLSIDRLSSMHNPLNKASVQLCLGSGNYTGEEKSLPFCKNINSVVPQNSCAPNNAFFLPPERYVRWPSCCCLSPPLSMKARIFLWQLNLPSSQVRHTLQQSLRHFD
jgi:hypothetical protein